MSGLPEGARRGMRYVAVGAGTALLELVLFRLLYWATGGNVAASNVAAVAVATLCNFLLNRSFTFRSGSNPVRSMVLYVALLAFNTAFSTFAIGWLVGIGAEPAVAKVLTQGCVVVWNYFLYNKVVFK